jgi:hypothetical protein
MELVILTPSDLSHHKVANSAQIRGQADSLLTNADRESLAWQQASKEFLDLLLAPIQPEVDQPKRILLVLPSRWDKLPLEQGWNRSNRSGEAISIRRLSNPQSLISG